MMKHHTSNIGEGNVDSDVNIAKLALALETDAAIAYTQEAAKLKNPKLISVGASIGATESAHAAAIRATFKALGVKSGNRTGIFCQHGNSRCLGAKSLI
jgi:rubrerythrin